jgi:hypothetical protein
MFLTLRVTEERKRISSVATHRVPHIDIDQAVINQITAIADQFKTTPHVAASMQRVTGRRIVGILTEVSRA